MSNLTSFKPFSTIPPSEAMMRVGLGCLALEELGSQLSSLERKRHYMTLDNPEELNQRLSKAFDINFPPMAIVNVYRKMDVAPTTQDVLHITDLSLDTVVFDIMGRLPLEANWQEVFSDGNYQWLDAFLVFTQGGHSHFFKCGGQAGENHVESSFLDFGKVGTASCRDLMEQYALSKFELSEEMDPQELKQLGYKNWLLVNALIANLTFTAISIQG